MSDQDRKWIEPLLGLVKRNYNPFIKHQPYSHPYQWTRPDGTVVMLPRKYEWYGDDKNGWWVWNEKAETYLWQKDKPHAD